MILFSLLQHYNQIFIHITVWFMFAHYVDPIQIVPPE